MSFKETDFTGLIGYLKGLIATQKDPMLFREMVCKMVEIYDQLPVYPGLVNMCVGQAQKTVEAKDIKVGQKVFITTHGDCVCGVVSAVDSETISISNAVEVTNETTSEVGLAEIDKAVIINENIVKELWPSLIFDKEQK